MTRLKAILELQRKKIYNEITKVCGWVHDEIARGELLIVVESAQTKLQIINQNNWATLQWGELIN